MRLPAHQVEAWSGDDVLREVDFNHGSSDVTVRELKSFHVTAHCALFSRKLL